MRVKAKSKPNKNGAESQKVRGVAGGVGGAGGAWGLGGDVQVDVRLGAWVSQSSLWGSGVAD